MQENKTAESGKEQIPHSEALKQEAIEATNKVKENELELENAFKYFSETNIGHDKYSPESQRDISFKKFGDVAQGALEALREGIEDKDNLDPSLVAEKVKVMIAQMGEIIKRVDFKVSQEGTLRASLDSHPEAKVFAESLDRKVDELEALYAPMATRLAAQKEFEKLSTKKDMGHYYGGGKTVEITSIQNEHIDMNNNKESFIVGLSNTVSQDNQSFILGTSNNTKFNTNNAVFGNLQDISGGTNLLISGKNHQVEGGLNNMVVGSDNIENVMKYFYKEGSKNLYKDGNGFINIDLPKEGPLFDNEELNNTFISFVKEMWK